MQGGGLEGETPAKGAGVDHLNQHPGEAIAHRQGQQRREQPQSRTLPHQQAAAVAGAYPQALQCLQLATAGQPQHHKGGADADEGDAEDQQFQQFGHHKGLIEHLKRRGVDGGGGQQVHPLAKTGTQPIA